MFFQPLSLAAALLLTLTSPSLAQTSVPSDLSSSFDPSAITIQVLYPSLETVQQHGIADGSSVSQKASSQPPSFALGDSSGINPSLTMLIMLVDTTSPSERMLHFLQTGFSSDGDATAISSNDSPLVPYAPPGTLGEPSGKRQYSWLVFQQPDHFKPNTPLGAGDFDVQSFQQGNGLQGAIAGVAMFVDVAGLISSGGGGTTPASASQQVPAPSQQPTPSTQAQTSTIPIQTINPAPTTTASMSPSMSMGMSSASGAAGTNTSAASPSSTSSMAYTMSGSSSTGGTVTSTTFVGVSPTSSAGSGSASGSGVKSAAAGLLRRQGVSFAALPVGVAVAVVLLG